MAKLHTKKKNKAGKVIKCGRCGHVITAGETYYSWTNRIGRGSIKHIRCAAHYPRPSEMTMSEHLQVAYSSQEAIDDAVSQYRNDYDAEALRDSLDSVASDLDAHVDTLDERISNMQDAFPNGCPSLSTLEEYKENFESFKDEVENARDEVESLKDTADETVEVEHAGRTVSVECDDLTKEITGDDVDEDVRDALKGDDEGEGDTGDLGALVEALNTRRQEMLDELVEDVAGRAEGISSNF
jgi:chromosome segregation ATPase